MKDDATPYDATLRDQFSSAKEFMKRKKLVLFSLKESVMLHATAYSAKISSKLLGQFCGPAHLERRYFLDRKHDLLVGFLSA
jgi:hypothetical protein